MPSSKIRHRLEIDRELYDQLHTLATREGYPVSRFADKLLHLAAEQYVNMRKIGRHPFAGDDWRQAMGPWWDV
jgi:hypothetical protein